MKKIQESQERIKKATEEEKKELDEKNKEVFNITFEMYKGNLNGDGVKVLLNSIVTSNKFKDNKITVEMNGISATNAIQINFN